MAERIGMRALTKNGFFGGSSGHSILQENAAFLTSRRQPNEDQLAFKAVLLHFWRKLLRVCGWVVGAWTDGYCTHVFA